MEEWDETTAWHEAGHAVIATLLGGKVEAVSVESEDFQSAGDTRVRWDKSDIRQQALDDIQVALAGPVAEMVFVGDYDYLRIRAEHEADWNVVSASLSRLRLSPAAAEKLLNQIAAELYQWVRTDNVWAAIGDVADRILLDGTIDGQTVQELVDFWDRR